MTVLLTTFQPRWLLAAARSVLDQSFRDFELLILDDEDSPATRRDAASLADDRVRYSASTGGALGPAGNHDRGLRLARGEFVAIINHDDVWRPDLLARLHSALAAAPSAVAAFGDHDCIGEDGVVDLELSRQLRRDFSRDDLEAGLHQPFRTLAVTTRSIPVAQAVLWRRSVVDVIPRRAYGAYDLWLAYWLSRDGAGAVFVPDVLASWRVTPGNLTSRPSAAKHAGELWVLGQIVRDRRMGRVRRAAAHQWVATSKHAARDLTRARWPRTVMGNAGAWP